MPLLIDCGSGITRRLAELAPRGARSRTWRSRTFTSITRRLRRRWCSRGSTAACRAAARRSPSSDRWASRRCSTGSPAAFGDWLRDAGIPARRCARSRRATRSTSATASRSRATKVPHTAGERGIFHRARRAARRLHGRHRVRPDVRRVGARRELLLCECSLPAAMAIPEHLTPEQCGALAAAALPKHLVLTHFYPPVERVDIRALVAAHYAGPVTLADDGWHVRDRGRADAGRDGE